MNGDKGIAFSMHKAVSSRCCLKFTSFILVSKALKRARSGKTALTDLISSSTRLSESRGALSSKLSVCSVPHICVASIKLVKLFLNHRGLFYSTSNDETLCAHKIIKKEYKEVKCSSKVWLHVCCGMPDTCRKDAHDDSHMYAYIHPCIYINLEYKDAFDSAASGIAV